MVFVIIGLSVVSIYLFFHLFHLKKALKNLKEDFIEVTKRTEVESHVQINCPDKDLENLAEQMNEYIALFFENRDKYQKNVIEIRSEITNLSHDLRTPLTSILGYLEFIQMEGLSEEQLKSFEVVKRRSNQLNELVEQLYEYTRLENKEYPCTLVKLDLYRALQEHILEFYDEFENKGIELKLVLPKQDQPIWIMADTHFIKRILTNLTSNLLKYASDKANIILTIDNNWVSLTYQSSLGELTSYDIVHLFDRFYRKDMARAANRSSGLGLTIAKLFAERIGGEMFAYGDDIDLFIGCKFPTIN